MAVKTRTNQPVENIIPRPQEWRWYHGVIFYLIVQVLTFGLSGLVSAIKGGTGKSMRENIFGNPAYFNELRQSIFAPPSWVFGPAWLVNNVSVILGTWRILNKPEDTPGRTAFLALQGVSWLNFVVFNAAYFSLRSPINALVLTFSMFVLTILSVLIAIFKLKDTLVALSLATLFIWLIIALTAASFQTAWNYDDLYHVGPFVKTNQALLKKII